MNMATKSEIHACPSCHSGRRVLTAREQVPGGTDWRHYECPNCGYEWRT